jgi:hypothetical protein
LGKNDVSDNNDPNIVSPDVKKSHVVRPKVVEAVVVLKKKSGGQTNPQV